MRGLPRSPAEGRLQRPRVRQQLGPVRFLRFLMLVRRRWRILRGWPLGGGAVGSGPVRGSHFPVHDDPVAEEDLPPRGPPGHQGFLFTGPPGAVRITRTGGGPAPTGRRMAADPVRTGEVRGKRGIMNPIEHLRPSRLPAGPLLSAVVLGAGTHVLVSLGDTGACRRAHGRLARVPSAAPRVRRPLWREGAVEISRRSGTTGSTRTGRRRRHPPPPAPPQRRASRAHTASKTLR